MRSVPWRLKESRFSETKSLEEQVRLEDGLQVYKWSQENRIVQISDRTKLAVGSGFPDDNDGEEKRNWGFGIAPGSDLWQGTNSPCITLKSPGLSQQP
jgi:hypothetical protein